MGKAVYKYAVKVDGRTWIKAKHAEPARAAADSAARGWAKGKKIEVVELTERGEE